MNRHKYILAPKQMSRISVIKCTSIVVMITYVYSKMSHKYRKHNHTRVVRNGEN